MSFISVNQNNAKHAKEQQNIEIKISLTGVRDIANSSFFHFDKLVVVEGTEALQTIGGCAFAHCTSLKSFAIGNQLNKIGEKAFFRTSSLEKFEVSKENECFSSEDGVLYNKDKTTLLKYPQGRAAKSFLVPNSVKVIASDAFEGVLNLKSLYISDNVENIEQNVFDMVTSIENFDVSEKNKFYVGTKNLLAEVNDKKIKFIFAKPKKQMEAAWWALKTEEIKKLVRLKNKKNKTDIAKDRQK